MASNRNRPDLESNRRPFWPVTPFHDIQMQIGQAMRLEYELPQELPDTLLTLLMQLTGQGESD
jgi:hypothetical protein